MKGNLTREQAIALVGEDAVCSVERKNCQPTNRVGYNGSCQGDDLCEWSASVGCSNADNDQVTLTAYYYTTNEQDRAIGEADGDGSVIDWTIHGYDVA